ncbi:tRNA pseudouridine(55) synthase TruB [uncultured Nocardioides sp.]|uniref:tRNA pseudouridine(55) synthase TruB n=1 Tax=uncultured Nocardioides sp. TaxID=198441 RepID=UPI0025D0699A|nr:tRNA pseudouridine(55) synthase TruB [uncultured Nocardioides sp.]
MTEAPVGLVVVDKPAGMTSHDVVARTRRLAGTRKVGHAGTLDPMATGVLVLGVGRATRLLGHLMLTEKAYDATIRLGATTTTDDAEGEPLTSTPTGAVDEPDVRSALATFVGEIEQRPSAVSAIKVDGRRAYQRVRDGESVELPARPVTIHEITVGDLRRDGDALDVDVSVRCSSGTYVRAVARDLGERLGVGGHLTVLRRTAVGGFDLAVARTLEELADELTLVPLEDAARATFPVVELDAEEAAAVRFGRPLERQLAILSAVFSPDGRFLALYEPADGRARPVAVFLG